MTALAWPGLKVSSFLWKRSKPSIVTASQFGSQAITTSAPVWEVEMSGVPEYWEEVRRIQAFLESFDDYTHQLELWDLTHPVPAGTMRGDLVLASYAFQGATTISVDGGLSQAGKTLRKGDFLGLGTGVVQQLVRVMEDATANASGVITVKIGTPLRNAFSVGSVVTWDKPRALFRQKSLNQGIQCVPVVGQPWSLTLIEDWRP